MPVNRYKNNDKEAKNSALVLSSKQSDISEIFDIRKVIHYDSRNTFNMANSNNFDHMTSENSTSPIRLKHNTPVKKIKTPEARN
jgi:hypothetical protein